MSMVFLCDNMEKYQMGLTSRLVIDTCISSDLELQVDVSEGTTAQMDNRSNVITVTISVRRIRLVECYFYDDRYEAVKKILNNKEKPQYKAHEIFMYIMNNLGLDSLLQVMKLVFSAGMQRGEQDTKTSIKNALGIF